MAELFHRDKSVITRHIGNIYSEGELLRESTSAKIAFVPETRDRAYEITCGTQFRIWATQRLKEYIIKGFTMDDERLKGNAGGNYWKELLSPTICTPYY